MEEDDAGSEHGEAHESLLSSPNNRISCLLLSMKNASPLRDDVRPSRKSSRKPVLTAKSRELQEKLASKVSRPKKTQVTTPAKRGRKKSVVAKKSKGKHGKGASAADMENEEHEDAQGTAKVETPEQDHESGEFQEGQIEQDEAAALDPARGRTAVTVPELDTPAARLRKRLKLTVIAPPAEMRQPADVKPILTFVF